MDDDDFTPRLGRIRARDSKRGRKYLHRVLAAAALAGGLGRRKRRSRFDGSRVGRGAAIARMLGTKDRFAGLRGRRAIVKTRLVRLGGKGQAAARAHLRYIQRDGVARDGAPGALYARDAELADGKDFLDRCEGDRHQFRFILSAEDGAEFQDLRPLTRRFMAQMEEDLGTRLEWVAADHLDTGRPHTHVMLRGRDEQGGNLVIARDYITRGMRERLAELVTLDLGPRTDREIRRDLMRDVQAERLTRIDRQLLGEAGRGRDVAAAHRDPFRHALRAGRLRKLRQLGLAEELEGGRWRLADDLETKLRRIGERGDIVRTLQRALRAAGLVRIPADTIVHEPEALRTPLVGRVVARGLSDELNDRHYLVIDAVDGRVHHVEIGEGGAVEPLSEGSIVKIVTVAREARPSDRMVAAVAAANQGRYSIEAHHRHDPSAGRDFVQAHVRRLEALRRSGSGVERLPDGSWVIPADHVERAARIEQQLSVRRPVEVEPLSASPLSRLEAADAATWLDRELTSGDPTPLRDAGFGREVRTSLAVRRQWLLAQRLAQEGEQGVVLAPDLIETLRRRELLRTAAQLERTLGLSYVDAGPGLRFNGRLDRRLDLASGRFALIANEREFSLVPWRPSLERQLGRDLEVSLRGSGLSWTMGRGRGGPEIS